MDQYQAIAKLASCHALAHKLACHQGIQTPLTPDDLKHLHEYEEVVTATDAQFSDLWLDDVRRCAGLLPSDMGLLRGALDHHYDQIPAIAKRRLELLERHLKGADAQ